MSENELVRLEWITPGAEERIVRMARVSADPSKKSRPDVDLIRYLIQNQHWTPFEMANICFAVSTSRAIGRQMLRHWTMRPQEFSQRYQDATILGDPIVVGARLQDPKNRQASTPVTDDDALGHWWHDECRTVWEDAVLTYQAALQAGIAKEVARVVLPEGMTPTRMYFNAPIRTALHFCALRSKEHGSQDEIVAIAQALWRLIEEHMPVVAEAFSRHLQAERDRKRLAATVLHWLDCAQRSADGSITLHASRLRSTLGSLA